MRTIVAVVVTTLVMGLAGSPALAQGKVIRFAHHHPVNSLVDITAKKFAEAVNRANAGITVQVFPAAQLGQEQENAEAVHYGTVDASITGANFFNKWVPAMGFEFLPFLFKDQAHVERALGVDAPVTLAVRKALAEKSNAYFMGYLDLGFRDLGTRVKQVTRPEDLRGLKMRAPEIWTWIRMYQLLGSNPTPITWGEVYTSLKAGVVDGFDAPAVNMVDNKHYEVIKYVTKAGLIDTSMAFTVNRKLYEGLTPAQQKVIQAAGKEALDHGNKESRALTAKSYTILQEKGIVINQLDTAPLSRQVQPMYEEFVKKNGGKEFIDLVQSLRDKK